MKIGLTLSGGGFRATVFHLGVLARLAEEKHLEDVTFLSTVSGGSLCGALMYAQSGNQFPTSSHLIDTIIPNARKLMTTWDLSQNLIWRVLRNLFRSLETRGDDLAALIGSRWHVHGKVCDLPPNPRWIINATCYETARNWRFERALMGDNIFGYSYDTDVPLREAVASSCGFPGLIGALGFKTEKFKWFNYRDQTLLASADIDTLLQAETTPTKPLFPKLHLWDGGVFDNMGLEVLMDGINSWHHGVDFLIASDANSPVKPEAYHIGANSLMRMIVGVMMEQVLTMRKHQVLERRMNHGDQGVFVSINNSARKIFSFGKLQQDIDQLCAQCLSDDDAMLAADTPTDLKKFDREQFDRVFRHGFEVTNCTLSALYPDQFKFISYAASHWGKQRD